MNYVKALVDFITNDTDLQPLVWDRVDFLRNREKYSEPFIVFTEWQFTNDFWWFVGEGGPDQFTVIFDIITKYDDFITARTIRQILIKKLNWINQVLTADWSWSIGRISNNELLYNEETDQVSLQVVFIFKTQRVV